jgi:hypothetical protein
MSNVMTRRTLLGAIVALPAGVFIVHCSSSSSTDSTSPGAPPQRVGTQTIFTSSVTISHSHTFTIDDSAIASPPAAGLSGPTVGGDHSHNVSISMADLQHMAAGQTVVTATTGQTHSHVFTFLKVA